MSYSVDLQYTISEDFSGLQTVTESGQPTSMTLQGLQSNQTYYTKAILKNDGVVEDETEITSFQTLPAGTITLNHYQTTRSGYDYEVVYLYSSTYAPSWARLAVNGSTFQGTFDSAQHAVSFLVTGLTPGTAYLDLVTMGDIYGEEASVQGSIVTTVVNDVDITSVDTAYTSADVNVEYIVDGGFYVAYVEWWLGTQDPSVDPAEGHEYFTDGDNSVTISGLNDGTEYKFRASITLNDQTTTIVSNVVAAITDTDYSSKYFTIVNTSGETNIISLKHTSNGGTSSYEQTIYYSTDNGSTWRSVKATSNYTRAIAQLSAGQSLLIKHTGAMSTYNTTTKNQLNNTFVSTKVFDVCGNIASLTEGDNFRTTGLTMPGYAFNRLFADQKVVNAKDLYFGSYTSAGGASCESMFSGCNSLLTAPQLPMTSVNNNSFYMMFDNCRHLTNTPELPAKILKPYCYTAMFRWCIAITDAPNLKHVTTWNNNSINNMYYGCTSLHTAYAPSVNTWNTVNAGAWLYGVAPEGVLYKPADLTIPTDTPNGVPEGWTTEDY